MTYEQFKAEVSKINGVYLDKKLRYLSAGDYISVQWCTGGMTGGSCWGTEADHEVSADREPELTALDAILLKYRPAIGFLEYKILNNELVKVHTYTNNEYYGNYYHYSEKYVNLKDLYQYMGRQGWLED